MIDYQTYCQIRELHTVKKLTLRQIARELNIDFKTVQKWAIRESFQKAPLSKRPSKLDPFKGEIVRLLERHDYPPSPHFLFWERAGERRRRAFEPPARVAAGRHCVTDSPARSQNTRNCTFLPTDSAMEPIFLLKSFENVCHFQTLPFVPLRRFFVLW